MSNLDAKTVAGFGEEWSRFTQMNLSDSELREVFDGYFRTFPMDRLTPNAQGFDMGCGSGRWARFIAPRVAKLHCIDASREALDVAKAALSANPNCVFHHASVDALDAIPDDSMDFGYSLGVLHHIPDTQAGLLSCSRKLKAGAPFLLYLYYRFDDRPSWFKMLWRASDVGRRLISRIPVEQRHLATDAIAALVYLPLAKAAQRIERYGKSVDNFPLSSYRNLSFDTMRTDALDRFGTRLEQRFTKVEIEQMLINAGFENISFGTTMPFWCATGYKR